MGAESNEEAVLAGLVRAQLDTGQDAVPLEHVFEGCGRRIPASVLAEVLDRLIALGEVKREHAAETVVQLAAGRTGPVPLPGAHPGYAITETGFERHRAATEAAMQPLLAELPARIAAERIGPQERILWAELYDYLSWRRDRSLHLQNFGLGHRLTPEVLRRLREVLLRLGLIERAQTETHVRLTELGRRVPRLPGGDP